MGPDFVFLYLSETEKKHRKSTPFLSGWIFVIEAQPQAA